MPSVKAFQQAEDEYFRRRGQLAAGRITAEQFNASLKGLMVEHEGSYWMLGAKSGKWYMHDGQDWLEADPPTASPTAAASSPGAHGMAGGAAAATGLDSPRQATTVPPGAEASSPQGREHQPAATGAATTSAAEQQTASGQLFQTLFPQTHAKVVLMGRENLEALARILQWMRQSRTVTEEEFKTLHAAFRCQDAANQVWTVGLRLMQWYRLERGQWVAGHPPDELHVGTGWLRAMQWRVPRQFPAQILRKPAAERQGVSCARCGTSNTPDKTFCTACAAPIAAATVASIGTEPVQIGSAAAVATNTLPDAAAPASPGLPAPGAAALFAGHTDAVHAVAFSPDGRFVLSGGQDGTARLWDLAQRRELRRFEEHDGHGPYQGIHAVAFSPDRRHALIGGELHATGSPGLLCLWEVESGREVRRFAFGPEASTWVKTVAFSPNGRLALSGGNDATVRVWEVESGRELRRLAHEPNGLKAVNSVAFAPDGRHAISASDDETVRLWDLQSGQEVRRFTKEKSTPFRAVAISPDGRYAATDEFFAARVRLRDLASGATVRDLDGKPCAVNWVAFSPDGRRLLAAFGLDPHPYDGRVWDYETDGLVKDDAVRLWDVETGRELAYFVGHARQVNSVAFSPNGRLAASASNDGTVRIWRLPA
jgi:WD40 repeat protein